MRGRSVQRVFLTSHTTKCFLPACAVDDFTLNEAVDVLKLLLPAGQRLGHRGHVKPDGTQNRVTHQLIQVKLDQILWR